MLHFAADVMLLLFAVHGYTLARSLARYTCSSPARPAATLAIHKYRRPTGFGLGQCRVSF